MNMTCDEHKPDCKAMWEDIDQILREVEKYLFKKETMEKILSHYFHNVNLVSQKWLKIMEHILDKDYYRAGSASGDLVKFILFFDYEIHKCLNFEFLKIDNDEEI
jgi:hypothetical protein